MKVVDASTNPPTLVAFDTNPATSHFNVAQVAVDAAMDACYREAFGRALAEDFGADWRDFYPFPQIPAVARRAPVFPSTSD